MSDELYKRYRPKLWKEVIGQREAVGVLRTWCEQNKVPHFVLFTGHSGCGKTTLARIMKKKLDCGDNDFQEVNCADFNGIDTIREIRRRMGAAPLGGKVRIWLVDECHTLTTAAQNAFLKMLEDTPEHVYFFLATTDPQKLLPTVKTRANEVKVKLLSPKDMTTLITTVVSKEGKVVSEEVVDKLVEHAEGSARKGLVLLHQVLGLDNEEDQLQAIAANDTKTQAIEIARALINPRTTWPEMTKILKGCEIDDAESLRYMVLGYCTNVLLGAGKLSSRAALVIQSFRDNFYDSKKAGLVIACYEVISTR